MNNLYFYVHPYRSFQRKHQETVRVPRIRFGQRTILSLFVIAVVLGIPVSLRTAGADSTGCNIGSNGAYMPTGYGSAPSNATAGQPVTFTSTITGCTVGGMTSIWNFGDGTVVTTSSPSITHRYNETGILGWNVGFANDPNLQRPLSPPGTNSPVSGSISIAAQTVYRFETGYRLIAGGPLDGSIATRGLSGDIQVRSETVNSNNYPESIAQWVSLDYYPASENCGGSSHDWLQEGWTVGYLPNGQFTSTPVLYVETTICGAYTFLTEGTTTFGSLVAFEIYAVNSTGTYSNVTVGWNFLIHGNVVYSTYVPYGIVFVASAGLEIHEPSTSPNASGNGDWSYLQYVVRCNVSDYWVAWGSDCPGYSTNTSQFGGSSCLWTIQSTPDAFQAGVFASCDPSNVGIGGGGVRAMNT